MRPSIFIPIAGAFALSVSGYAADPLPPPSYLAAPAPGAKVYFSGNEWFSVAADRVPASNYVSGVADRVAAALARCGFDYTDLHPGRITVYVNSDDGSPSLSTDEGRTLVRIPLPKIPAETVAADFTSDRAVARALVRAALTRLAQAAGRKAAPSDWVVEALAWESQISAYPGLLEWLVRTASAQGPGTLEQVAENNPDSLGSHSRASFILLRALREENKTGFKLVVAKAAMGRPLPECLEAASPGLSTNMAAWWPAAFYREIDRRPSAIASPAASARRFAEISRFVVLETPPGDKEAKDIVLDLGGLIERRGDNAVREEARRRVFELKRDLLRASPVWFNTLRDYGVFLEKLPTASPDELRGLASDVTAQAVIATNLTAEIERALSGGL